MCFNPGPERRVPSPNRYIADAKFCFCKNNKRIIIIKVKRLKVRLVLQGQHMSQAKGDFTDAFSPVLHLSGVRCCMSMATAMKWKAIGVDLTQGFIQAELPQDGKTIYISPPPGHVEEPDVVYQVLKPLYAAQ